MVTQCGAMQREGRGPWVRCTQEAKVTLWHGTRKCGPYCMACANRFIEAFPVRTFTPEFLPDREASDATG